MLGHFLESDNILRGRHIFEGLFEGLVLDLELRLESGQQMFLFSRQEELKRPN